MTRTYWTAATVAAIAFGFGVTISANATGDQTDPQLVALQQIEKNTETTNAQLILLNQQISKLASSLVPKQSGSAPRQDPPPARN